MRTLIKVLVFTAIAMVMTVALGMKIANIGFFGGTYELSAQFSDARGVFEGDAVKLAGVDVGRVTGTAIEDGKAIVTFQVDDEVSLPIDSRVGIRWRNVIGLRFLYLFPGTDRSQVLQEGDLVTDERTDEAGDIGALLNELGPILKAIDPQKANAFLDAVNTALAGNEVAVRTLFSRGADLARELGTMDDEIKTLIGSSDRVLAACAGQSRNIAAIIEDLDAVAAQLSGMTEQIDTLVINFAAVQRHLDRLLRENRGNIDSSIGLLNRILGVLARDRHALERTLCTLPPGVAPYYQTTSWGEWFNVRIPVIVFKDNDGTIIAQESEDNARPPRSPSVVGCPSGTAELLPKGATVHDRRPRNPETPYDNDGQAGGEQSSPLGSWLDAANGGPPGG